METLVVGAMATNCYIAGDMIIDPGDDAEYIMSHLTKKPKMIIATHGHFDHILSAYALQLAYNIPFYIHEDDIFLLSHMESSAKHFLGLKHVDPPPKPSKIKGLSFIHTPGHTPGSICIIDDGALFTGDTLFADGAVGRTDFSYSDPVALQESITRIRGFSGHKIYAGHNVE